MQPSPYEKQYVYCPTCRAKLERRDFEGRALLACPACSFVFWNNPKPVASVIIHRNGKVLMLKRNREPWKGYWVIPGGYLDYPESPGAAAVREAREETGLDVKLGKIVGVYLIDNDPRGNTIDTVYDTQADADTITISEESGEFQFFSPDELPEQIAFTHREAILDWQKRAAN